MKIIRSFGIVAGFTLLSHFLGYVREAVLAARFGASSATDAYFAAFFIPNTLYLILIAGSVSTAFIPVFLEVLEQDRGEAWNVASSVFNICVLLTGGVVLAGVFSVELWMSRLFPGFGRSTLSLSIELSYVLLPMLLFIGLSSLSSAALNACGHFTLPALAPVVSNLIVILATLYASSTWGIQGVAVGVLVGTAAMFLIQIPALKRVGLVYKPVLRAGHPAIFRIIKLSLPLIAYLVIAYGSVVVERRIASTLSEGTVSAFSYAVRIFTLPISIFAGSLGTVIYPHMSSKAGMKEYHAFKESFSRSLGASLFVLLPLTFWLVINSNFVVGLLYGRGSFKPEDVRLTGLILSGYTIGMAANGITGILQRGFYALQDTTLPMLIELISLAAYTGLAAGLTVPFGPAGLASARGFSFILVAALSLWRFQKKYPLLLDLKAFFSNLGRTVLVCCGALLLWGMPFVLRMDRETSGFPGFFLAVLGSGLSGFILYLWLVYRFNLDEGEFVGKPLRYLTAWFEVKFKAGRTSRHG